MVQIVIECEDFGSIEGEILTDRNPKTAQKILDALPIESGGSRWGQEIYFSIPVKQGEEDSQEVVEKGDLAYWPPGNAFCIFWGRTPASTGDEIRPASAVNVFGRLTGDLSKLDDFSSGSNVTVDKA